MLGPRIGEDMRIIIIIIVIIILAILPSDHEDQKNFIVSSSQTYLVCTEQLSYSHQYIEHLFKPNMSSFRRCDASVSPPPAT